MVGSARGSGLAEETSKPHECAPAKETKHTLARISKQEDAHGVLKISRERRRNFCPTTSSLVGLKAGPYWKVLWRLTEVPQDFCHWRMG